MSRNPSGVEVERLFALCPTLTYKDCSAAMACAGRRLSRRKTADLRRRLNRVLSSYFHVYVLKLNAVSTSARLKRLAQIAAAAKKLLFSILGSEPESRQDWQSVHLMELRRQSLRSKHAPNTVDVFIQGLQRFVLLANGAYQHERMSADNRGRGQKRNKGRRDLDTLFVGLNDVWMDTFHEVPGVSIPRPPEGGEPGGPYVEFVFSILGCIHRKIEPEGEVNRLIPDLKKDLYLSRTKIRSRFRKTGISYLRREVADY